MEALLEDVEEHSDACEAKEELYQQWFLINEAIIAASQSEKDYKTKQFEVHLSTRDYSHMENIQDS